MFKPSLKERKEDLAKTAAIVFCEKGYQAASLQDVARKKKISKAGIYHYFKTKEDILAYILIQYTDRFLQDMQQRIALSEEKRLKGRQAFQEFIRTYAAHLNKNKELRLLVLRERHQLTGKNKRDLLRREQSVFHILKNELTKIPDLNKQIDPNVISFLFIAACHWIGYWFSANQELNLEEIVDQNINIIYNGIFKKK